MENLDSTLVSGAAILLSFVAGYKYAGMVQEKAKKPKTKEHRPQPGEYKMVLVVRNDLKMGKGKIGAQCGHAAVGAYEKQRKKNPSKLQLWEEYGSAKIALKVESEEELVRIYRKAREANLNTCMIHDAGRTQIEANSKTVCAIGPDIASVIDNITGHLKLL